jgi:hypothetical protein
MRLARTSCTNCCRMPSVIDVSQTRSRGFTSVSYVTRCTAPNLSGGVPWLLKKRTITLTLPPEIGPVVK